MQGTKLFILDSITSHRRYMLDRVFWVQPHLHTLTYWGHDKTANVLQATFSIAFSWMKMYKFRLRFPRSVFPRVKLAMFQHWLAWRRSDDKPLSETMMVSLLTHICVTRPQRVNTYTEQRTRSISSMESHLGFYSAFPDIGNYFPISGIWIPDIGKSISDIGK